MPPTWTGQPAGTARQQEAGDSVLHVLVSYPTAGTRPGLAVRRLSARRVRVFVERGRPAPHAGYSPQAEDAVQARAHARDERSELGLDGTAGLWPDVLGR